MENSKQKSPISNPNPKPKPKWPKLKAFQTIQNNFAIIGIDPKLVTQPYPFNKKIFMGFLALGSGLVAMVAYNFNNAKTFFEYTLFIYMGCGMIFVIFVLLILILQVEKLFVVINRFDGVINTTLKYSASRSIFYETNQFEEKLSRIVFFVIIKITSIFITVPWTIYIFLIYFFTDLGNEAFELPCPMWLPFDWRNPFGFLISMTMQYAMLSYGLRIGACVLVLAIGIYLYVFALSKCIKGCLFSINRSIQAKTTESNLLEQIIEFVQLHSSAKQVISDSSDLFQHFITTLFTWSLITICDTLLLIQMELIHHSDNLVVLLITMVQVVYGFGIMFIACELGHSLNFVFDECSDMIDQFNWYLFPVKVKRLLPLILHFAQQPIVVKCFGSAACDRDTFKSVIKTAFSYFTILRQWK